MWTARCKRLSLLCSEVSGWLIVPMMISIFLDAILRGVFNIALMGIVESNSLLLVAIVYMGLAGAQSSGAHFRVTLVSEQVPAIIKRVFIWVGFSVVLIVTVLLAWFTLEAAWFSFERAEISYGLVDFPIWPGRFLIAFGFLLLVLQMVVDFYLFFAMGADPFNRSDDAPIVSEKGAKT